MWCTFCDISGITKNMTHNQIDCICNQSTIYKKYYTQAQNYAIFLEVPSCIIFIFIADIFPNIFAMKNVFGEFPYKTKQLAKKQE